MESKSKDPLQSAEVEGPISPAEWAIIAVVVLLECLWIGALGWGLWWLVQGMVCYFH